MSISLSPTPFYYTEIYDNIPSKGCNLDDFNATYEGCDCGDGRLGCNSSNTHKGDYAQLSQLSKSKSNHHNLLANEEEDLVENNKISIKDGTQNIKICTCIVQSKKQTNYDAFSRLNINFRDKNWKSDCYAYPIIECSMSCNCDEDKCMNRVVQLGCKFELEVFDCDVALKGKGVKTKQFIPAGSFVIEYLGELIGSEEAEKLLSYRSTHNEPNYIMFLKETYSNDKTSTLTIIDAKNYSNMARFINHSCEPNLILLPVRINNIIPHAALFAARDIEPFEELSYDYNGMVGPNPTNMHEMHTEILNPDFSNRKICYCGSSFCKKFLPINFN